ncbi:MAG: ribonuclease R [Planctomycetota bacterium]|nr:MAG: ribonuclease R [Planctomycetota bacterium]
MSDRRDEILAVVSHPDYRAMKPKAIARFLGLSGDDVEQVRKAVKRMVREGLLAYGPNHLVLPVAASTAVAGDDDDKAGGADAQNSPDLARSGLGADVDGSAGRAAKRRKRRDPEHVVGTFRRLDAGFGFVRPEGARASEGRDADIFIPANAAGDAASGDTVSVKMSGRVGRGGKAEGRVIDVISRFTNQFVGTYFEQAGMGMVQIDGKVFAQPIYVGDPGAKGVRPDDKVVIEMVRFPSHVRDGEGVVVEVLGNRGLPGVDTLSIIHEFGLPGPFAEDTLEESRRQAELFDESIGTESSGARRQDLAGETIITIDPATARDFDDAISLEKLENGHWLLGVHIADVSHFVQPKTPLDREAKDRATSVYLPDRVIPMLPEVISNNLASLQPGRVRYAITARMEFTEDGVRVSTDVFKSAIKSRRRFTYEEVDEYLLARGLVEPRAPKPAPVKARRKKQRQAEQAEPAVHETLPIDDKGLREGWKASTHVASLAGSPREGEGNGGEGSQQAPASRSVFDDLKPEVDALLKRMFTLAMTLRARRFRRGALELNRPELEIDLDMDGRVVGAHLEENTESHQIIEEFMLAANEAVAEKLRDAGLVFLRRVHGPPDPRKLKALTAFVGELGVKTESLESRFALQKLLNDIAGDPREHAINYATLRSMQRAVYSPEDEGHYALASECYCHFTSPIRRYPDLTIHRLIDELAQGKKPQQSMEQLLVLGDHCSDREQRATEAERELNKVKLLNYLADKIGLELSGYITGVESYGLFITGAEIPAEGFVPLAGLTDDYYRYDRAGHVLQGLRSGNAYRLGDSVRVAVAAVDVDRRELDFRLVGRTGRADDAASHRRAQRHGPLKPGKKKGPRKGKRRR